MTAQPATEPGQTLDSTAQRSLLVAGTVAALAVTGTGLAVITLLVLVGFVAAPHAGFGLPAVLRTAAMLWLVGHHVGVTFRGAGRIGMLPLGLVVLPGALLWRAGRFVVRAGGARRLRQAGGAALALAIPYAVLSGALAIVSRSALASSSLPQAVACGFLLALSAGGLGAARTLATWPQLIRVATERSRSLVLAVAGSLTALAAAGVVVAGISLATRLHEAVALQRELAPGAVGTVLLLLLQLGYVPNAIIWAIAFMLGPGFAFGSGTVVAPAGSALAQLPAFPLLAALPPGLHGGLPGWLEAIVLALPYLAGGLGGALLVRALNPRGTTPGPPAVPRLTVDAAALRGLACGVLAGVLLGLLAAVSGGPLGDGRLAAVGPSPWQVGVVSALELGIAAAVTAGAVSYLRLRRAGAGTGLVTPARRTLPAAADPVHVRYLDPWAGEAPRGRRNDPPGPSALP